MLLSKLGPEHPLREDVRVMVDSATRAGHLTQQLLAYMGQTPLENKHIDISNRTREIENLLHTSISNGIVLRLRLADDLPSIDADPAQIDQILLNLVLNARRRMR